MNRSRKSSFFTLTISLGAAVVFAASSCTTTPATPGPSGQAANTPATVVIGSTPPPAASTAAVPTTSASAKPVTSSALPTYPAPARVAKVVKSISVSTATELVAALESAANHPGTEVLLAPGEYNLTKLATKKKTAHYYWDAPTADTVGSLTLDGISNLRLASKDAAHPAKIVTDDRRSQVLTFKNASNIDIADVIAGHTKSVDMVCLAVVFGFEKSHDIVIQGSTLFGSGTHGVFTTDVDNFTVYNSTIKECTQGHATIDRSHHVRFTNDRFTDTKGSPFDVSYSTDVVIEGSEFSDNVVDDAMFFVMFSKTLPSEPVTVKSSRFTRNNAKRLERNQGTVKLVDTFFEAGKLSLRRSFFAMLSSGSYCVARRRDLSRACGLFLCDHVACRPRRRLRLP